MDSFVPQKTETETRKYFEKNIERDLLKRPKERIEKIERRFAPVGIFHIERERKIKSGLSKVEKTVREQNKFYINLNNLDLYYVSTRGIFRRERYIANSDLVKKIIDLPMPSIEFLSDIINKGRISHNELNKKYFLFLDGNFDHILILRTRGLIGVKGIRMPTARQPITPMIALEYVSKVNIPEFSDIRYDLKEFLAVEKFKDKKYKIDKTKYNLDEILEVIKMLFDGNGKSKGKIYMPYDQCKYVDNQGRYRYKRLIIAKFK